MMWPTQACVKGRRGELGCVPKLMPEAGL